MNTREELTTRLRAADLRVTAARLAVLGVVRDAPHAQVDTIVGDVRRELGAVSTQAVYDVLRALLAKGLVRRVEPAGSPARYEIDHGDNHHHLVCRGCGTIVDVPCAVGEAPCLEASLDNGFVVDEAEVTWWGTCGACQATRAVSLVTTPDPGATGTAQHLTSTTS